MLGVFIGDSQQQDHRQRGGTTQKQPRASWKELPGLPGSSAGLGDAPGIGTKSQALDPCVLQTLRFLVGS